MPLTLHNLLGVSFNNDKCALYSIIYLHIGTYDNTISHDYINGSSSNILSSNLAIWFGIMFRYGNVDFVDERHRHRYEVNFSTVLHGQGIHSLSKRCSIYYTPDWVVTRNYWWCTGQSKYDITTWKCWSIICWQRWNWSAHGGKYCSRRCHTVFYIN